jgi:hypothetical protein
MAVFRVGRRHPSQGRIGHGPESAAGVEKVKPFQSKIELVQKYLIDDPLGVQVSSRVCEGVSPNRAL